MRPLRLTLTAWALICSPALAAAAPRTHAQYKAEVRTYRTLDAAGQQQWLRSLVRDRMQPAAELTLSGEDLDRQQTFAAQVLQRAGSGRTLSDDGIKTLLARAEQLERAAVEKLERLYRVDVYQSFRSDRRELDLRMAAWKKVDTAFVEAGSTPQDRQLLLAWLQDSVARLERGNARMLPPMPKFGSPAPQLAAAKPDKTPAVAVAPPPNQTHSVPNVTSIAPPKVATQPSPALKPADGNAIALPRPPSVPAIALPAAPRMEIVAKPLRPTPPVPHVVQRPVRPIEPAPQSPVVIAQPAAAQQRTVTPPATIVDPVANSELPVQVDLDELTIRITGYNLALSSLASRLHEGELSVPGLEEAVVELSELVGRRGDLILYCNLLPKLQRQQVPALDSSAAVVSQLAGKISSARRQVSAADFAGTAGDRRKSLETLDVLSRQLAQLAAHTAP